jgi:hypothetical protein
MDQGFVSTRIEIQLSSTSIDNDNTFLVGPLHLA